MAKIKLPFKRRLIQLASALIYNANFSGFASGTIYKGDSKGVCVPGLNCYSCPGAIGSCPLGALQNAISNLPRKAPFYIAGFLMLIGITLGRIVCGFLCPFGLIQELLHKIPTKKIEKSKWTRYLTGLKYIILLVFVIFLPIWYAYVKGLPVPAFCKYICPTGTLEGGFPLIALRSEYRKIIGFLFGWKTLLCVAILVLCIFFYRAFCRFLCPLGAIYSFFAKIALLAVRVDTSKCTDCGLCIKHCKMDIKSVGDRECIHCCECCNVCPHNAIYIGLEKKSLQTSKGKESIL